jgi:ribosomal protein S18 acetylase RimI-like enzyme
MSTIIQTSLGKIIIRQATMDDVLAYHDLRLECLRDNPTAFGSDFEHNSQRPIAKWEEILAVSTDSLTGMLFFAAHEDKLVGMAGIRRRFEPKVQHNATIFSLFVQPAWRGQHIAEALLKACCEWSKLRDVRNVKLAVVADNIAAIRCYLRNGFQIYGVEPKVICVDGKDYDELLLWRQI